MPDHHPAEAVLQDLFGWALNPIASVLVALCEATGLRWGPVTDRQLFFYRSPFMHVFEFVVFHLFVYTAYLLCRGYLDQHVPPARMVSIPVAARHKKTDDDAPGDGADATVVKMAPQQKLIRDPFRRSLPRSLLNKLFGYTLLLCFTSQVVLKAIRPQPLVQLCWLTMPCHVITLVWVYILLQPKGNGNYRLCVYLASVITGCHWGPVGAAASPDWSDHQYKIEGKIFVVHHGLLVLMPFYFAARYDLLPFTFKYVCHVTWVATLVNVCGYTLLSYVSGLNVNYHLHPPPKLMKLPMFDTPFYRFYVIGILILLAIFFRMLVGGAAVAIRLIFQIRK
jgi:hypothetical protein